MTSPISDPKIQYKMQNPPESVIFRASFEWAWQNFVHRFVLWPLLDNFSVANFFWMCFVFWMRGCPKQRCEPWIKLLRNLSCLKVKSDLEWYSPEFKKDECCKNTDCINLGQLIMCHFCHYSTNYYAIWAVWKCDRTCTNHVQLIMCCFCSYFMNYLQIVCLLNAGLDHSRSKFVFETRIIILFSEWSITTFSAMSLGSK